MTDPFDGTFIQNLQDINSINQATFTGGLNGLGFFGRILQDLNADAAGTGKTFDGYLATLNENKKNVPQSWDSFIGSYNQYLGKDSSAAASRTLTDAVSAYLSSSGQDESGGGFAISTFLNPQFVSLVDPPPDQTDYQNQFKNAFGAFLEAYPFNSNGSVGNSTQFFQNFNKFLSIDTTVFAANAASNPANPFKGVITSFEQVFNDFPPPSTSSITTSGAAVITTPTFASTFSQFYQGFVAEYGFFTPSQALSSWTEQLIGDYSVGLKDSVPITDPTSGLTGNSRAVVSVALGTFQKSLFQQVQSTQLGAIDYSVPVVVSIPITTVPPGLWSTSTDSLTYDTSVISPISPATSIIQVSGTGASQTVTLNFRMDVPADQRVDPLASAAVVLNALKSIVYTSTSAKPGTRTFGPISFDGATRSITDTAIITGITEINTSVTTGSSARVLVLNRLYILIASMIDSLQKAAATQAEYLNFLTQWQSSYTALIGHIQTYTRGDGSVFGNVDSLTATVQTFSNLRNDANNISLNRREQLSNLNNAVGDEAKRIQSNINASQDAGTQQGQFATSIIQQLTTLLSSIYH